MQYTSFPDWISCGPSGPLLDGGTAILSAPAQRTMSGARPEKGDSATTIIHKRAISVNKNFSPGQNPPLFALLPKLSHADVQHLVDFPVYLQAHVVAQAGAHDPLYLE